MTTITNFLESNFVDSAYNKEADITQNPIWILNFQSSYLNQSAIKQYIINQAVHAGKPLMHIDLGISSIKKYPSIHYKNIEIQNGAKVCQPVQNKPYFLIRTPISLRTQTNFLTNLISQINSLYLSLVLKKLMNQSDLAKKYEDKYCLLIQGIQSMLLLNKSKEVESFISQLSNLHQSIKQISIFTQEKLMNKELIFCLQRISTCLSTISSYNQIQGLWQCTSTVRRYTGYSNQESYTLELQKPSNKIKVTKKLQTIQPNQETKQQQQMVKSLGFVVKKQQKDKEQIDQLKKMIYPHLKVVGKQCNCKDSQCKNPSCKDQERQNEDEGLIILDDEQEDEDDIDV